MKVRIIALVAIALLATTAVAFAKTNVLTGRVTKQPGSTVKVGVKLSKQGVASKITTFNLTNVTSTCSNRRGDPIPGKTVTSANLGTFKVDKKRPAGSKTNYYAVFKSVNVDGNQWNVEATFSSKTGRKLAGTASFNYPDADPNGGGTCDGGGRFSVTMK